MNLKELKSIPCEKTPNALSEAEIEKYLEELNDWQLEENKIKKVFKLPDFKLALQFVNKVGAIAEEGSHHPDISISYNKVEVTLWTHRINGLSVNDFIVAAKIDELP